MGGGVRLINSRGKVPAFHIHGKKFCDSLKEEIFRCDSDFPQPATPTLSSRKEMSEAAVKKRRQQREGGEARRRRRRRRRLRLSLLEMKTFSKWDGKGEEEASEEKTARSRPSSRLRRGSEKESFIMRATGREPRKSTARDLVLHGKMTSVLTK